MLHGMLVFDFWVLCWLGSNYWLAAEHHIDDIAWICHAKGDVSLSSMIGVPSRPGLVCLNGLSINHT
jgi:hypothetical protein